MHAFFLPGFKAADKDWTKGLFFHKTTQSDTIFPPILRQNEQASGKKKKNVD